MYVCVCGSGEGEGEGEVVGVRGEGMGMGRDGLLFLFFRPKVLSCGWEKGVGVGRELDGVGRELVGSWMVGVVGELDGWSCW